MFQNNTPLQKLNINMDKSTILRYTTKFGEKQSVKSHPLFTLDFKYFHQLPTKILAPNLLYW